MARLGLISRSVCLPIDRNVEPYRIEVSVMINHLIISETSFQDDVTTSQDSVLNDMEELRHRLVLKLTSDPLNRRN